MGGGRVAEDFAKAVVTLLHALQGPGGITHSYLIMPFDMVPGVNTAFVAGAGDGAHFCGGLLADIGAGQQHTVRQCFEAVMFNDRGARNLFQKAGTKYPAQCAAGVVFAEAE